MDDLQNWHDVLLFGIKVIRWFAYIVYFDVSACSFIHIGWWNIWEVPKPKPNSNQFPIQSGHKLHFKSHPSLCGLTPGSNIVSQMRCIRVYTLTSAWENSRKYMMVAQKSFYMDNAILWSRKLKIHGYTVTTTIIKAKIQKCSQSKFFSMCSRLAHCCTMSLL